MCEHSHHITHHKPKEEKTKKKFLGRVLGRDGILDTITHHKPKEENTKKKFLGRVLGPDGILTTSHHHTFVTFLCVSTLCEHHV